MIAQPVEQRSLVAALTEQPVLVGALNEQQEHSPRRLVVLLP